MSDELRAAPERLRDISNETHLFILHCGFSWHKEADVLLETADLIEAEHPADDAEPVTEEWLKGIGFDEDTVDETLVISIQRSNHSGYYHADALSWDGDCFYIRSTQLDLPGRTRGDVRRLCRSLGIELKEGE